MTSIFDNRTMMFLSTDEFLWSKDTRTFVATTSDLDIDTPAEKLFIKNPKTGNRRAFYLKSVVWLDDNRTIRAWKYESNNGRMKVTIAKMIN